MNGERMDSMTKEKRSYTMSRIKGLNTKPELAIRKYLEDENMDYDDHPGLFGKPDFLVNAKHILFVDGCFWHGCKRHYKKPKSNTAFWESKLKRNIARRKEVKKRLKKLGYSIIEIWEHEIKNGMYKRKIQRHIHGGLSVRGLWRIVFGIQMGRLQRVGSH